MNKILIIIEREFLKRIQKKSFIVLTIVSPLIMAALIFVPLWLSSIENDEQQHVAVIDPSGQYFKALKETETFHFTQVPSLTNEMRSEESPYDAVVSIPRGLLDNKAKVCIYSRKEVPVNLLSYVQTTLDDQVRQQRLKASGIAQLDKIISEVEKGTKVETVKWNDQGDETISSSVVAMVVGFLFTFLIYMFVVGYGGLVMQSVIEEKANRIVELMVSSVKPFELMMGKIIGVMLVGLLQMAIWAILFVVILSGVSVYFGINAMDTMSAANPAVMQAAQAQPNVEAQEMLSMLGNLPLAELAIMFLLMFVGGYLLYASFFAATGASINEQEDSSQFVIPVTMITLFGFYAAMYSVENIDGPLAFWTSLFPLTSPIVMMVRIPFGVPLWQELLSVVLLYATAFFMVWAGGKIYRVGILMYGKKPSMKEIIKWMRYK